MYSRLSIMIHFECRLLVVVENPADFQIQRLKDKVTRSESGFNLWVQCRTNLLQLGSSNSANNLTEEQNPIDFHLQRSKIKVMVKFGHSTYDKLLQQG